MSITTYRGPQDLRVIMGEAGERAAIGAFDALWMKAEKWRASEIEIPLTALRSKSAVGVAAVYGGVYHMTPDLWLPEHTALVECKASFAGRRFYTTKRQFEAYRWAQSYAVRPVERPAVYYAFAAFEHPAPEALSSQWQGQLMPMSVMKYSFQMTTPLLHTALVSKSVSSLKYLPWYRDW